MLFDPADPRFFSPLSTLRSLQSQVERLFGDPGQGRSMPMAFALFAKGDGLLLRTPLPGVEAGDIALETDGNALTVSGQWTGDPEGDGAAKKHIERPRGRFTRTLRLPFEVDAARVQARLERGVLEVEIPRLEKNPPVKIQVLGEARRN
jgi:HSP20 family protein